MSQTSNRSVGSSRADNFPCRNMIGGKRNLRAVALNCKRPARPLVYSARRHHVKALYQAQEITLDSVARHTTWNDNDWRPIRSIPALADIAAGH